MEAPDWEALAAEGDRLAEEFEASYWPETGWIASQLLHFKVSFCRPDLRSWQPEELAEVLLQVMPRKSSMEAADIALVVPTVAAFLRWSGQTGRLDGGSDGEKLAVLVESLAGPFVEAMHDESRWGMAKRMFAGVDLSSVDLSDPASMQQVMDDVNARSFEERGQLLGLPAVSLPPVVLAPPEQLTEAARAVVWVDRVAALCDFLGDKGRAVTPNGNLKLADARALLPVLGTDDEMDPVIGARTWKTRSSAELTGLSMTVSLGVEGGVVEDHGSRLLRAPEAAVLRDDPALAVQWLVSGALQAGPLGLLHAGHEDRDGFDWYVDLVDNEVVELLLELYAGATVAVSDWEGELWEMALEGSREGITAQQLEYARIGLRGGVRRALRLLAELGVLDVDGEWPDRAAPFTGTVALSPLGTSVLHGMFSQRFDAPVVGRLADAPVAELLRALPDLGESLAAAELDHWLSRHGPQALVDGLAGAGESGRGLAFRGLLRLGVAATPAVGSLAADPELSAWVEVWRVDVELLPPTPVVDPGRLVEVLGAVVELWGAAAVGRWVRFLAPDPLPLLDAAWRVRSPVTETVLAAVGELSDDKVIAKAARKALFKHRSAH